MATKDFAWQALPGHSFRILILDHGQENDPLSGQMKIASLNESVFYETISYAWGERVLGYSIDLGGRSLSITQRVYNALRRVRHPSRLRRLWIDAVCIDQDNVDERATQVSLMQDIFAGATKNVIYLGPHKDNTAAGIAAVESIKVTLSEEMSRHSSTRDLFFNKEERRRRPRTNYPVASAIDDEALHGLFDCRWFTRLWVVQEAALSRYN